MHPDSAWNDMALYKSFRILNYLGLIAQNIADDAAAQEMVIPASSHIHVDLEWIANIGAVIATRRRIVMDVFSV